MDDKALRKFSVVPRLRSGEVETRTPQMMMKPNNPNSKTLETPKSKKKSHYLLRLKLQLRLAITKGALTKPFLACSLHIMLRLVID